MALGYWGPEAILYSTNGDPAKRAWIEVRDEATNQYAFLYSDANGVEPLSNPLLTDEFGNLAFYTDPGTYFVKLSGSAQQLRIVVDDPSGGGGGPGPGGGSFEFVQSIAQSVWTVQHNLGYRPAAVSLFSMDYQQQYDEFAVQHVNTNQLLISMDTPTAGRALM